MNSQRKYIPIIRFITLHNKWFVLKNLIWTNFQYWAVVSKLDMLLSGVIKKNHLCESKLYVNLLPVQRPNGVSYLSFQEIKKQKTLS